MTNKIRIPESELILNPDSSIYHLNLKPGELATTIITVGDPDRVDQVTKHFDKIRVTKQKREFKTVTGSIGSKDISVVATGIGTDNIDIVMNEIDALFNIDFGTRTIKDELTSLDFVRIGTSGCIQPAIPVDSFLVSKYAIETEQILAQYEYQHNKTEEALHELLQKELDSTLRLNIVECRSLLLDHLSQNFYQGITYTAGGFYAPQGRAIRLKTALHQHSFDQLASLRFGDTQVTNIEMETAGIYGLANLLGHSAISFNALLANRATKAFSTQPNKTVHKLIEEVLQLLTAEN